MFIRTVLMTDERKEKSLKNVSTNRENKEEKDRTLNISFVVSTPESSGYKNYNLNE